MSLRGEVQITIGEGRNVRTYSSGKAIIGDPFRQIVSELRHGQEITLEYRLLKKDLENVTVYL